jgi:hypothetical protein
MEYISENRMVQISIDTKLISYILQICMLIKFINCFDQQSCQNSVSAQLLRNRWAEWYAILRDDRGYDVVVQHASHF